MATATAVAGEHDASDLMQHARMQDDHLSVPLTDKQLAALALLRKKFPKSAISHKPKPWCKACSEADAKHCREHKRDWCEKCQTKVTEAHNCLSYVGHAEATSRLLEVDPTWFWKPLAKDERGLPLFDHLGGMWIELTVCGMTRIGYGAADGKKGPNAVKEVIGDAIRNAGMRFGMALDLWSKTDLHPTIEPEPHPADKFVQQIRDGRIWMSAEWLAGVRNAAEEAGQLDYVPEDAQGVTLGDIIDGQLKLLADVAKEYAELKLRREEERAAAARQIAVEVGALPADPEPAPDDDELLAPPPPPTKEQRVADMLHKIKAAATSRNLNAMEQNLGEARNTGIADEVVTVQGQTYKLGELLQRHVEHLRYESKRPARPVGTAGAARMGGVRRTVPRGQEEAS